jgi:hypothetical protein
MNDMKREIGHSLNKVLRTHGYGFQYSALQYASTLFENRDSQWQFDVAEFPVELNGKDTHIDFILEKTSGAGLNYLIMECKRASPSLSRWCFLEAPYTRRNADRGTILVEELKADDQGVIHADVHALSYQQEVYHISQELKSREQGDSSGSGRGAIEDAVTQLWRGTSGLIEYLANHPETIKAHGRVQIIPAIFTTAQIYTSGVKLGESDLSTGNLLDVDVEVSERPWIWYQYNLSPSIKHSVPVGKGNIHHKLGDILVSPSGYARSVAVVGPTGIKDFLKQDYS